MYKNKRNKIKMVQAKTVKKKVAKKSNSISKNTQIIEIIQSKPKAHEIMAKSGLHCVGCGGAAFESLEDGAKAHGFSDKKIKEMVDKINKS
jgi:hybrid cluster-associated redox disulfide protein